MDFLRSRHNFLSIKCNNKLMGILFVYRHFYPFVGGTEKQGLALASSLLKRGIFARVITSRFERSWPKRENIGGVEVIRLPNPKIKYLGACIFIFSLAWYLFRIRNSFSIIQTEQINYVNPFSILIGVILGKPTVLKLASSGTGGDIKKWDGNPVKRMFIGLAKKATVIVALSDHIINELRDAGFLPGKIRRIGNGVDLSVYRKVGRKGEICKKLGLRLEGKNIIYTGRLSPEKGLDFLIRAFSRLDKTMSLKLLIVGEGREEKKLKSLAKQLEVTDSVIFVNSGYDINEYLQVSDLFILPSYHEGLSNSLLEAMACGLPVISTRVGGSIDVIEDGINGLLVDVGNEEQLIYVISSVLNDTSMAVRLGENARKTVVERYNLDKIVETYVKLYSELDRAGNSLLQDADERRFS